MPINRSNVGQNSGQNQSNGSRLTSATISSSAKCKSDANQCTVSAINNDFIMKRTTNLTRTRSLRLPSRTKDHNYLMSGQLIHNNNDHKKSFVNSSSVRTSSESSSSQQSTLELTFNSIQTNNNVTQRSRKSNSNSSAIKEALIPKFVRNSFGKLNKSLRPSNAMDDSYVDKYANRETREVYRRQESMLSSSFNESYLKSNDCPSSPVSNSSRDSGIIGFNGNNSSQNYLNLLRKLTEEHERLQIEYSRVRQQLIETNAMLPNKPSIHDCPQDMPQNIVKQLENERSLSKSYKSEVIRLQEDLKRLQRKYWDNIINGKVLNNSNNNNNTSDAELNSSHLKNINLENEEHKNFALIEKVENYEKKIKELENETKDAKESIEFLTSERSILAESLKEAEENLLKERLIWIKEKEQFEEVKTWSKRIYEKLKEKSEKLKEFETIISEKDEKINDFIRNENSNKNITQNVIKLLNNIRNAILSVLTTYQTETAVNLTKIWPQFGESVIQHSDDMQFDDNLFKKVFENYFKETEELKLEMSKENMNSKQNLLNVENMLKEKNAVLDDMKNENELNQNKLKNLYNELDVINEKYRCSESVNKELKNIIEESNEGSVSSQNVKSLRLEMIGLKESLAVKENMIDKISSKFSRNRKVWEENDRKATQEIKKLDDVIDHVIDTLKTLPENLKNSEQIQEILELLTEGMNQSLLI